MKSDERARARAVRGESGGGGGFEEKQAEYARVPATAPLTKADVKVKFISKGRAHIKSWMPNACATF